MDVTYSMFTYKYAEQMFMFKTTHTSIFTICFSYPRKLEYWKEIV